MDINKLYQYITTFNLINITIKNIAINTVSLWRRPVLGQSEIVCTVAILNVQGDTAISLCRVLTLLNAPLVNMSVANVAPYFIKFVHLLVLSIFSPGSDFIYLCPGPDFIYLCPVPDFIYFESGSGSEFYQGSPECDSRSGFYQFLSPVRILSIESELGPNLSIFESGSGSGFYQACPSPGQRPDSTNALIYLVRICGCHFPFNMVTY